MSVIVTIHFQADGAKLEAWAAANKDAMAGILGKAKAQGLIAHRFYADDSGSVMVLDEWPDPESFQLFFEEMRSEIEPLMRDIGVTEEPQFTFWRKLESHDEVGWDA